MPGGYAAREDRKCWQVPTRGSQRRSLKKCTSKTVNSFKGEKESAFKPDFNTRGKKRLEKCTCLYTNADQLMNKRNELLAMVDVHSPDIIGITEVKPNSRYAVEECELAISGYDLFHNLNSEGRGVALYVRTEMKPSVCEAIDSSFKEHVSVECRLEDGSKMLIALVYRSPSSTVENIQELNALMKRISELGLPQVMIMGDFNFPEIDWKREVSLAGPSHIATSFLKTVKDCFFLQKEPTRFREGERILWTNRDDMVSEIVTTCGLGKSDHLCLVVSRTCSWEKKSETKRLNFRKTDFAALRESLASVKWQEELEGLSVEDTWHKIKEQLTKAINDSTPTTRSSGSKRKSWMTTGALASVRKKHKLFSRWQETRDGQDYLAYVKERNRARKECRNAQKKLEKKIAAESKRNPKAFWSYVKSKMTQTWACECTIVYYIFVLFVYYYVFILSNLATH
jgi:hypothetical protein